jgi:quinol---cytochrome c reductase iron-sulfur subunit, bacillus type
MANIDPDASDGFGGKFHAPLPAQRQPPEFPGRRSFLVVLIGVGTAAVAALLSVPLVVYALDPLFRKVSSTQWSDAGPESKFADIDQPSETVIGVERTDGWRVITSEKPIYVLPAEHGEHRVLSPVCPHLGCEITWQKEAKRFYCPCHNSVFSADGKLVSGPSPRGMDGLESKSSDGHLLVHYQYFRMLVGNREVME